LTLKSTGRPVRGKWIADDDRVAEQAVLEIFGQQ
jgi:hypothetical protein